MSGDLFERRLRDFLIGSPNPDEPPSLHVFLAQVPAAYPHAARPRRAHFAAIAAAVVASLVGAALLGALLIRGVATPSPSPIPSPSAAPSGAVVQGPKIGTAVPIGEHAGGSVYIAASAAGAIVAVTQGETDTNGSRSCPASVFGSVGNGVVTWTDAPASVGALASTSGTSGPMGLGWSADCTRTVAVLPDGKGAFTARPVDNGQLVATPNFLATKPGDATSVAAWQTDPLKGGFLFWSADSGLTWRSVTAARPAGWDASGRFWSIFPATTTGGPSELVNGQGPGFSAARTGIVVDTPSTSITGTAVFRDRILIAANAAVLSVSTTGGATARLDVTASSLAAGTRFVAVLGRDNASGRVALAISADGVHFTSAQLPDEFNVADDGLLRIAVLDDRVVLTEGTRAIIRVWSIPITDLPAAPPSPSPIPISPIPTQPPAQATSTWTTVTPPSIFSQGTFTTFGGAGNGFSALPGGGFMAFVPAAPGRFVVLTSPDAGTWKTTGEIIGQDAIGEPSGPVAFNGHVYVALGREGGGGFYGTQSNGAAWVSTDLAHWTKAPAQVNLSGAIFGGIAAGPSDFVAIGFSQAGPTLWTSSDGLRWQPFLAKSVFPPDLSEATGIETTGQGLVIVGRINEAAATWTSPDGKAWTVHSPLPPGSGFFGGIAAGPAGFVSLVTAPSGGIEAAPGDFRAPVTPWTSADGITWRAGPSSPALFGANAGVVAAPGGYVAVGTVGLDVAEHLWSSTDGTNWVPIAGVDLGGGTSQALVSDGRHVLLVLNGPSGMRFLVTDRIHG